LIGKADGSVNLSMFQMVPGDAAAPVGFGDSEVVLFVLSGAGAIDIAGRKFPVAGQSSITLRPGERFTFAPSTARAVLIATVCPHAAPEVGAGGAAFDERFPDRIGAIDDAARRSMGDRFYQVLTTPEAGADQITQFIGEIPLSRAAAHRHLYEEAIVILSGAGFMRTQTHKAAVQTGDIIFLPRKQLHSLECTDPSGMRLAGSFFPAGSPAINY
jgi:mannose-6-phosphate isomerase-like protein (cupin superfamily)